MLSLNALVQGVIAAEEEARALGYRGAVGFNVVPAVHPADAFWTGLGALADGRFRRSVDHVGPGRSEQRQAAVLDTVVRTVAALAGELNIDGCSPFAPRDAGSHAEGLFPHFGLLHDDDTPAQVFRTYRDLIEEPHIGDRSSGCDD
ncbi:hypothetical protein ACFY00_23810 [Kitasatospora sp. NPDC001540]|uniref:hypothetical protein n=1 Tax=Kitasatospora sp. NPDC001540 TaxID=3364014 RepID=UPI0036C4BF46